MEDEWWLPIAKIEKYRSFIKIEDIYSYNLGCKHYLNPFALGKKGIVHIHLIDAEYKINEYYKSIVRKYNKEIEDVFRRV